MRISKKAAQRYLYFAIPCLLTVIVMLFIPLIYHVIVRAPVAALIFAMLASLPFVAKKAGF